MEVGSIVKLNVGGVLTDFTVVHQGLPSSIYDSSCNGTWLLEKDSTRFETMGWSDISTINNDYAISNVHKYLNSTALGLFDKEIQKKIKWVRIPYRPGSGQSPTVNSGANGLSTRIFSLSAAEVGYTRVDIMPTGEGVVLDYFKGCEG